MNVRFYKTAEREFDDAVAHYEQQQPGLGQQYRNAVKEALGRIRKFPNAYSPISERTRRCLLSKFPYGIIYRHTDNEITVIAVAHLHRQPEYWSGKRR
ncbi:MAG: type II toxin-antitoxin system RelE/ParE family toxin [Gammaproteobacteria bacterium]|nr:type II toxin-antitoxin system RelE/ParE family toxin [Gammaproteobacteria bacterium]